jgi:cell division protein FtsB
VEARAPTNKFFFAILRGTLRLRGVLLQLQFCSVVFLRETGGGVASAGMRNRPKTALATLSPQQRLVLGALAAAVAIVALSLADPKGLRRLERLRFDIERQEQKNSMMRQENARLAKTVKDLSPPVNPAALEKAAREQLGFVRAEELLFKFE